jgi:hypothetical protein
LRKKGLYYTLWKQQGLERDDQIPSLALLGG